MSDELILGLCIGWTFARIVDGKYTVFEWPIIKKLWRKLVNKESSN